MESLEEQKKLKEYEEPEGLKKLGKYPHRSFREVRAGGARETEKIFRQSIESEAGVVEESLEKRSEALEEENPESSPKFSSKSDTRGPNSTTKSIVIKRAENSRSLASNCSKVP